MECQQFQGPRVSRNGAADNVDAAGEPEKAVQRLGTFAICGGIRAGSWPTTGSNLTDGSCLFHFVVDFLCSENHLRPQSDAPLRSEKGGRIDRSGICMGWQIRNLSEDRLPKNVINTSSQE